MTGHRLDPTPETTRDVFSRDHAPVLTVDPGDTVTVGSLDASGYLARQTHPGQVQPTMFPQARGHCLTGPIEVRGARPGDMLALRLLSLRPGDWGWTVAGARDTPVTRRLGLAGGPPSWLLWDLDPDAGQGRTEGGFTRSLAPFLGVMGDALDAMVSWMQVLSGVGKAAALALASTCVDLRITQVANQTWGVHAVLPAGVMAGADGGPLAHEIRN
jgi:acetamidase/formamidase